MTKKKARGKKKARKSAKRPGSRSKISSPREPLPGGGIYIAPGMTPLDPLE